MRYVKGLCLVVLVILASIGAVSTFKALEGKCWEVCENGVWCVSMGCGGGMPAREVEKAPTPDAPKPSDISVPTPASSPVPMPATGLLPKE